ncbi:hypothetical protein, partial [Archangium violaceum]|uniref:hypothetical protein n=1 Tax=Archangium violaceum TaxID=83451 RepID=UPI003C799E14
DIPGHKDYQDSLKSKLRDLRDKIDEALDQGKHPKDIKKMITRRLDDLSGILLDKTKRMRAGEKLQAVNWNSP